MIVELQDISKVIMGQSPKGESYNELGQGLPLLNGAADYKGNSFKPKNHTSNPTRVAIKGDILLGIRATIGNFAFADQDYCIGRGVAAIRVNEKKADKAFVLKYVERELEKIIHRAAGSTIKGIKKEDLTEMKVVLPPLDQQKKIAAILDAADAYRQKTKALIAKYDELTQSLFLDMFGDPVKNEKGWEIKPIKEFGIIITGNTPPRNNEENYNSEFIEWIKTDNIDSNFLYLTKSKEYLSESGLKKGRLAKSGSLLVACIAGSINSIGRSAIADRDVAFNQQINAIEPYEFVNTMFLYHLFRSSTNYIQSHASLGMKRMLSKGEFQKIKMIIPPSIIQNQFADRVQAIEQQKAQAQASLEKAEELFASLLQKAFKGELN